ncbi:UDP-glycosyltransferase UGT5-like [Eriocheir sinensis]|uniref:UDP-glycosyltransferase UGT5-like n=1 Tax=Eriocheir sinensis TaxID=95602 RepID=UPI0021C784AA|nr:UDP-glycosyltransferase UGT5-like [Eriocheir sinensis]
MRLRAEVPLVAVVVAMAVTVGVQEAGAARILMLHPTSTRSHKNFFMAIAENLAQRNHSLTFVTNFNSTHQRPNIREIFVAEETFTTGVPNLFNTSTLQVTRQLFPSFVTSCSLTLAADQVQSILREEFDLVMMYMSFTECFLPVIHERKVPFIYVVPNVVQVGYSDLAGTPFFPSLAATYFYGLDHPLTFAGRMISTLSGVLEIVFIKYLVSRQEAECRARKLCSEDMPSLAELRLNSSLFITNSVRTMENPTLPYTPTVVHAGGIHCRPAEPLPEDLQQWVAGAGKPGVIFFSLGTFVKSSTLPEGYKKVLLEVFGSLQQRVLWKWDEDAMEGLPPNVRLSKWLPQQDILGHQQLQLFITHGGLLSTQEASYHGVPVLGLPVAVDQHQNMKRAQREGWGRFLHWEDLNYDSLRGNILQMIGDTRFRDEAQRRAKVMRDQPLSPGDWTTYWVEYVLRHQGARHLRSTALDMPWYQLYNADVWAVVVVVTLVAGVLVSWLCYRILRALIGCCCRARKAKKD